MIAALHVWLSSLTRVELKGLVSRRISVEMLTYAEPVRKQSRGARSSQTQRF